MLENVIIALALAVVIGTAIYVIEKKRKAYLKHISDMIDVDLSDRIKDGYGEKFSVATTVTNTSDPESDIGVPAGIAMDVNMETSTVTSEIIGGEKVTVEHPN